MLNNPQKPIYERAHHRLINNVGRSPSELALLWFNSEDYAYKIYEQILEVITPLNSHDVAKLVLVAFQLGWMMHEIYIEDEIRKCSYN